MPRTPYSPWAIAKMFIFWRNYIPLWEVLLGVILTTKMHDSPSRSVAIEDGGQIQNSGLVSSENARISLPSGRI